MSEKPHIRKRVLLVDDDEPLLETMSALLDDAFDVTTVPSAEGALGLLMASSFDVVCTDLQMPGMNGIELLEAITARGLPIGTVLVTALRDYFHQELATDDERSKLISVVVLKPYEPQELLEAVTRAVAFSETRRAVASATARAKRIGDPHGGA